MNNSVRLISEDRKTVKSLRKMKVYFHDYEQFLHKHYGEYLEWLGYIIHPDSALLYFMKSHA
jgi:hypothetical protein